MSDPYGFQECESCAAKPGHPPLCAGCLHNRRVIEALTAPTPPASAPTSSPRAAERVAALRIVLNGRAVPELPAVAAVVREQLEAVVDSGWRESGPGPALELDNLHRAEALIVALEVLERADFAPRDTRRRLVRSR